MRKLSTNAELTAHIKYCLSFVNDFEECQTTPSLVDLPGSRVKRPSRTRERFYIYVAIEELRLLCSVVGREPTMMDEKRGEDIVEETEEAKSQSCC